MVNQAEGYRNDVIPKARGEAESMIRSAEGFKESRIKRSEGDAINFTTVLKEYRKAKSITEKRLYLETMQKVLPGIEKFIVPDRESGGLLNLLNLKFQIVNYPSCNPIKNAVVEIWQCDANGNYSGYKEYKQQQLPFEHGVSILDLIFNEGRNAMNFMKSFQ